MSDTLRVGDDDYEVSERAAGVCPFCSRQWFFTHIAGRYLPPCGELALTHVQPECAQFRAIEPEKFLANAGVDLMEAPCNSR